MHLLNAETQELEEFLGSTKPPYAILSHTWGTEEVTFQDMQNGKAKGKKGYNKIHNCCQKALREDLKYVWVDTCCIDKSSSAELSEAINSMFQWYKDAAHCYAYLSDFDSKKARNKSELRKCRWFKRGWTLQELIAPKSLQFFAKDWESLFSRAARSDLISEITQIPKEILELSVSPSSSSIAQRFAWAANRETSRIEDTAYCLMGLFGINMPLLYGEGHKAFIRLQEQIMRESDDQSIFAWTQTKSPRPDLFGLLALRPLCFQNCHDIVPIKEWNVSVPFSMTNSGLSIPTRLVPRTEKGCYYFILKCYHVLKPDRTICFEVKEMLPNGDQFARCSPSIFYLTGQVNLAKEIRNIFVRQEVIQPRLHELVKLGDRISFRLAIESQKEAYKVAAVFPEARWSPGNNIISSPHGNAEWLSLKEHAYFESNNWTWHSVVRVESILKDQVPGFIVVIGFNGRNNSCWVTIYSIGSEEAPPNLNEVYEKVKEVRRVPEASGSAQFGQNQTRICSVQMETANDDSGWLKLVEKWKKNPVNVVINITEK